MRRKIQFFIYHLKSKNTNKNPIKITMETFSLLAFIFALLAFITATKNSRDLKKGFEEMKQSNPIKYD